LDVHKKTVVACVLRTHPAGTVQRQVRTFATMTADLCALSDGLTGWGVTHVALESTGVYWQPVFNILESEERTIILVNAQHIKHVPGRKTDVRDAEWLADLLRHGLLRASFIPPAPIRELRAVTRYRKTLVQERVDEVNRLQKVLESANLKLAAVASEVLGWGRVGATCWPPCWRGTAPPRCWPTWRVASCAPRCPTCAGPGWGASTPTTSC
jgi:transposase